MSRARVLLSAAAALGCLFRSTTPAFSQVFLPPKGEGSVTVVVQQGLILYHLIPDHEFDRGSIRWNTVYVDFTYQAQQETRAEHDAAVGAVGL